MRPLVKVGVVAAGYLVALVVSCATVAVRVAMTSGPDAQASSGMHAFGDVLLGVAVFGVVALAPAGAALVFLRPHRRFWAVLSALGVGVAATGLAAAAVFAVGRHAEAASPISAWTGVAVLRILVAPLLALGASVCAIVSPSRLPRAAFVAAATAEAAVSAYGGFVWLLPLLLSRP